MPWGREKRTETHTHTHPRTHPRTHARTHTHTQQKDFPALDDSIIMQQRTRSPCSRMNAPEPPLDRWRHEGAVCERRASTRQRAGRRCGRRARVPVVAVRPRIALRLHCSLLHPRIAILQLTRPVLSAASNCNERVYMGEWQRKPRAFR